MFSILGAHSGVSRPRLMYELFADISRNSALYASSRTIFFMARNSEMKWIKSSLGRTNRGQTPLAAIFFSFLPGAAAFLSVAYREAAFREVN